MEKERKNLDNFLPGGGRLIGEYVEVIMKRVFMAILSTVVIIFAITACQPRYIFIPVPGGDVSEPHVHDYGTVPSGYAERNGVIYAIYRCSCGAEKEEIFDIGSSEEDILSISDEEQLALIDDNKTRNGENMIIIVGPDLAQEVLDRIGSNSTVILQPGNYTDTLKLDNSRWQSSVRMSKGWFDEKDYPDGNIDMEEYLEKYPDKYAYYTRQIRNLEIIGLDGAILEGGLSSSVSNASPDSIGNNEAGKYYLYMDIDGLVLRNLTFDGSTVSMILNGSDSPVHNVLAESCDFIGNETTRNTNGVAGYGFRIYTSGNASKYGEGSTENIDFVNCSFENYFQCIRLERILNSEIKDCRFVNTGHDAVELRGTTDENVGGVYSITGCYFDNVAGTAIGRSGFRNCSITILDNDFNNIAPDEDEEYKSVIVHFGDTGTSTEKQENNNISFTDNTYNGISQPDVIENGYTADRFMIFAE